MKPDRREQGSALVMVMVSIVVILAIVSAYVSTGVSETKATSDSVERHTAWFGAQAGLWAVANDLSNAGDGNLSGNATSASYTAQDSSDSDGDGFEDFSDNAFFYAQGDGYFEGRAQDMGGNAYLVRARSVQGQSIKTVEGLMVGVPFGGAPGSTFNKGGFGDLHFHLDSNVMTDSYDSDVGTYESHATTTTNNGQPIKNQNGGIGSNGDIVLDSNSTIFGDANPGPSGTVDLRGSSTVSGSTTPLTTPEDHPAPTWTVPGTSDTAAVLGVAHGADYSKSSGNKTINGSAVLVLNSFSLDGNTAFKITGTKDDVVEIYIVGGDNPSADPSFKLDSNSKFQIEGHTKDSGPTVKVYNVGKFEVNSNTQLHTEGKGKPSKHYSGDPIQFQYYTTYESSSISDIGIHFNSNNNSSGVFYGPNAVATYDSNSHLYGAVIAGEIEFNSNVFLHYDESLANLSPVAAPTPELLFIPSMVRELR